MTPGAKTSNTVLCRQHGVQRSFQGQPYTQDKSDFLVSHLIFNVYIQIPPGSFCAVSTFYLKINTFFFFLGQIGVLYSSCFARSPPHLSESERFEGTDKRHFSNQHFFP